ncbi:MAG: hypothetical protein A2583_10870 [Bdellovibrionales bacterium RIFOXYD1_FULL_53_11]|nr:MAG: hypothetical protein A2583_10870 [Bdellovibrionales bacterium RIFOXYD1_FULL_53_11]
MKTPVLIKMTDHLIVLAKPAGWLSIPGRGEAPCLLDWVRKEHGEAMAVHRLDVDTSGVIIYARTKDSHREASIWFEKHKVRKNYDLIAGGSLEAPVVRINAPVAGQPAVTQVECVESYEAAPVFLARARPLSGKRHQIRAHLAGKGCPLLGDKTYKGKRTFKLARGPLVITRVALHAASLSLPNGEKFEAPWPSEFAAWVEALRMEGVRGEGA